MSGEQILEAVSYLAWASGFAILAVDMAAAAISASILSQLIVEQPGDQHDAVHDRPIEDHLARRDRIDMDRVHVARQPAEALDFLRGERTNRHVDSCAFESRLPRA